MNRACSEGLRLSIRLVEGSTPSTLSTTNPILGTGLLATLMLMLLIGCASVNLDQAIQKSLDAFLSPFRTVVENVLAACGDVSLPEFEACLKAELAATGDTEVTVDDLLDAFYAEQVEEASSCEGPGI